MKTIDTIKKHLLLFESISLSSDLDMMSWASWGTAKIGYKVLHHA